MITFIIKVAIVYCFAMWLASRGSDAKCVEKQRQRELEVLMNSLEAKETLLANERDKNRELEKEIEKLKEENRKMKIEKIINGIRKEVTE